MALLHRFTLTEPVPAKGVPWFGSGWCQQELWGDSTGHNCPHRLPKPRFDVLGGEGKGRDIPEADPWGNAGRPASVPTRRGAPALSRSHSRSGCCGDKEGLHHPRIFPPLVPPKPSLRASRRAQAHLHLHPKLCPMSPPDADWQDTVLFPAAELSLTSWGGTCHAGSRSHQPPGRSRPSCVGQHPTHPTLSNWNWLAGLGVFLPWSPG